MYPNHCQLCWEGEAINKLFLLVRGEVEIRTHGDASTTTVGPGTMIGEGDVCAEFVRNQYGASAAFEPMHAGGDGPGVANSGGGAHSLTYPGASNHAG